MPTKPLHSAGSSPDLEIRGVGLQKTFSALWASVWPKSKEGAWAPRPLPWTHHCWMRWILTPPPHHHHHQPNKRTFHWYLNGEESTVIHIWRRLLIEIEEIILTINMIALHFILLYYLHYRLDMLKFNFILSLTFSG